MLMQFELLLLFEIKTIIYTYYIYNRLLIKRNKLFKNNK